ncbi:Protein EMSY-LIKE 1 [Bienertia sinuspersici]
MIFKIGSMVEVLSKKDNLGVWRCAQIVAHNGDGYTVKYFRGSGIAKDSVDKVPSESVRPCPRKARGIKNWVVGDVVEVLDDGYWRVSMIDEVTEDDYYYIRVIGSLDEFKVKKSNIRARQEWNSNKWVLMDKVSEYRDDLSSRMRNKSYVQSQSNVTKMLGVPESDLLSKFLKRSSPDHSSTDEAYLKSAQKRRLVEKEVGDACSFIGKVDNPVNQKGNLSKDNVQNCVEKTISSNKVNNRNHDVLKLLTRTSEVDNCVSIASSVASCSITNANSDRLLSHSYAGCRQGRQDTASLCSDADSHSCLGTEEETSDSQLEKEDSLSTHGLDLYGYRCVLESLYASGPLSWEQEIALTNLRMKLHVSNDEHLAELRRLKSVGDLGAVQTCKPNCHSLKDGVVWNKRLDFAFGPYERLRAKLQSDHAVVLQPNIVMFSQLGVDLVMVEPWSITCS